MDNSDFILLIDDDKARNEIRKLGFNIKGTIGILILGYRKNIIDAKRLKYYLFQIKNSKDIWISNILIEKIISKLETNEL